MKQKRNLKINSKRLLSAVRIACLSGALLAYGTGAYADVMANTALPTGGFSVSGGATWNIPESNERPIMNISQKDNTAVIKWDSFNIGSIATVNFKGNGTEGYSILNYVNTGGSMSQIHGTMNALNNGNVYLVNTAGVFIGKSAQIDVGSLHISNKKLDIDNLKNFNGSNLNELIENDQPASAAELMSLGNINANSVTFDGDRIVLDTAKLTTGGSANPMIADNITIKTTDAANVVLGYEAYDKTIAEGTDSPIGYANKNSESEKLANLTVKNDAQKTSLTKADGYMWVEDVEQLQAIKTNLSGNYALRNGIDATNTTEIPFNPIGSADKDNAFTGKLDGLAGRVDGVDFAIFDLHVKGNEGQDNVGLFGMTQNATIKNLLLTSGEVSGTGGNIGAVAGQAVNTTIENIRSSVNVTGASVDDKGNITSSSSNVGGIVGKADYTKMSGLLNAGKVQGHENVGGIAGSMTGGSLTDSRNLNAVKGINDTTDNKPEEYSHDIGGIVGSAQNAELMNLQNSLTITGGYNIGGIAGSIAGVKVENVVNSGNITANGYTTEDYTYSSNNHWYEVEKTDKDKSNEFLKKEVSVLVANAGGIVGNSKSSDNNGDSSTNNGTNESKASSITYATNTGNVTTVTEKKTIIDVENNSYEYYIAGNVGGIVGRAEDTNIANAENKENAVFGAHNVGGIAGLFTAVTNNSDISTTVDTYTISNAVNNGGEIKATGARSADNNASNTENGFSKEWVRPFSGTNDNGDAKGPFFADNEEVTIGNIGGIVGYMYGDNVKITGSGNRGTVHSEDVGANVLPINQAANVGGIVGKIDRNKENESITSLKSDVANAAVSNSYNTGDVRGYTGVGGIAGMMYNGEIASSSNLGDLRSTFTGDGYMALNMGGIVGDTTEQTGAKVLLYDVYNKGKIGDENFNYYGRHVGGIVGRLSGDIEKAYNTGEIYNASVANGGIVGWWYDGNISNVFNTGNITVLNKNTEHSRVGGIAGSAKGDLDKQLTNAYNLGTLRTIVEKEGIHDSLGGIIGQVLAGTKVEISNVYTTGELYCAYWNTNENTYKKGNDAVCAIIGPYSFGYNNDDGRKTWNEKITNAYYIRPDSSNVFDDLASESFNGYSHAANESNYTIFNDYWLLGATSILYGNRFNPEVWDGLFSTKDNITGTLTNSDTWRIYEGSTTPILNAFMPNSQEYFGTTKNDWQDKGSNIENVQYGTAYNPLLTIVTLNDKNANLDLDWKDAKIKQNESLAVYNGGLEITNFVNATDSGYYGGLIYADGALNLYGQGITINNDGTYSIAEGSASSKGIRFGSAAEIYGSSVNIISGGDLISYGSITATGKEGRSDVNLTGSNVEIIGKVTSLNPKTDEGESETIITIPGIYGSPATTVDYQNSENPNQAMPDTAEKYAYAVTKGNKSAAGNITITATAADGKAEVLLGNEKSGFIDSAGSITVKGSEVYVDSDLRLAGSLTLDAAESVLDLSNIGAADDPDNAGKRTLVGFLGHFAKKDSADSNKISFINSKDSNYKKDDADKIGVNNAKITLDMWNETSGSFNMSKYDTNSDSGDTTGKLTAALTNLQVEYKTPDDTSGSNKDVKNLTYIWISDAEQLAGIQKYYENNKESNILNYNFALKNDIDATALTDYRAIGGATNDSGSTPPSTNAVTSYNGIFDGRGNSIIGLNVNGNIEDNIGRQSGIFAQVGKDGSVKNLNVIAGDFAGGSAGAVAGVNNGTIENITTFGNRISSNGYVTNDNATNNNKVGAAGGIAGINEGTIKNVTLNDAVIASVTGSDGAVDSTAGGIAGVNIGNITSSAANSAVTASAGSANALGGVAGINYGKDAKLNIVESLGIVNGSYKGVKKDADGSDLKDENGNVETEIRSTENIGGIAGVNYNGAEISNAYNEAHLSGSNAVGGIVGYSGNDESFDGNKNTITNAVNAGTVISSSEDLGGNKHSQNAGGLAGNSINTSISNARNVGSVTGEENVGGLVGTNGQDSELLNVINDGTATITGIKNVGGIAGVNESTINAEGQGLINNGSIYGVQYVGGIAGANYGTINNAISNITLHINEAALNKLNEGKNDTDKIKAQYFGGTAGINGSLEPNGKAGTITNAVNNGAVNASGAEYVGGITGRNTKNGSITGAKNNNTGKVTGASYVGGVVGLNEGSVSGTDKTATEIRNEGLVIAEAGGAGGIIGVNDVEINNSKLINSGVVLGTKYSGADSALSGTGGVIGVNNKKIENSDLINTVDGVVVSTENAGGVIGVNNASVSGGRDNENYYYAHQVYNNGTVVGGKRKIDAPDNETGWTAKEIKPDENGSPAVTVYYKKTAASKNTGGVIGFNNAGGSLTAAYNTGAVSGGTNVGGIAGSNAGKIDQVFNTISVWDGTQFTAGAVSGDTNVGGITGNNSGTISNAYNTSAVTGNTNTGSIAGSSSGTVSNVYSTTYLQLAGTGSGSFSDSYSASNDDKVKNGITVLTADEQKALGKYSKGFVTAASDSTGESIWKFYNGFTTPLLRVFLTKATYNGAVPNDMNGLTVVIKENNTVVLQDAGGKTLGNIIVGTSDAAHSLMDFINSYKEDQAKENLIVFNDNAAGPVYQMLYSYQIRNSENGNPNNLGYDFVPLTYNENGDPIPDPNTQPPDYAEEFFWQTEDKYPWYQWDKQRNERERKAEVNFVRGGMEI